MKLKVTKRHSWDLNFGLQIRLQNLHEAILESTTFPLRCHQQPLRGLNSPPPGMESVQGTCRVPADDTAISP